MEEAIPCIVLSLPLVSMVIGSAESFEPRTVGKPKRSCASCSTTRSFLAEKRFRQYSTNWKIEMKLLSILAALPVFLVSLLAFAQGDAPTPDALTAIDLFSQGTMTAIVGGLQVIVIFLISNKAVIEEIDTKAERIEFAKLAVPASLGAFVFIAPMALHIAVHVALALIAGAMTAVASLAKMKKNGAAPSKEEEAEADVDVDGAGPKDLG